MRPHLERMVIAGTIIMAAGLVLIPVGIGIIFAPDSACNGQLGCTRSNVAYGIGTAVGGGGAGLLIGGAITGAGALGLAVTF